MTDLFAGVVATVQGLPTGVKARETAGREFVFRNRAAQHLPAGFLRAEAGLGDDDVAGVAVAAVAHAGARVDAAIELLVADLVAVDDGAAFDRLLGLAARARSGQSQEDVSRRIKVLNTEGTLVQYELVYQRELFVAKTQKTSLNFIIQSLCYSVCVLHYDNNSKLFYRTI